MNNINNYMNCNMLGLGYITSKNSSNLQFTVSSVSAEGAEIKFDNQPHLDDILEDMIDAKIHLSTSILGTTFDVRLKLLKKDEASHSGEYYASFVNFPEHKKVELDEIIKKTCIFTHTPQEQACEYGNCLLNGSSKKESNLSGKFISMSN